MESARRLSEPPPPTTISGAAPAAAAPTVESPGTPTILSDSEADSQPEDGYEFSPSPPPAKKVSSLWSKEGVAPMDQESADEEEHSNTPRWAVELRYILLSIQY